MLVSLCLGNAILQKFCNDLLIQLAASLHSCCVKAQRLDGWNSLSAFFLTVLRQEENPDNPVVT